jgi:transcription-repair coupling factor (superfamily II helicase)
MQRSVEVSDGSEEHPDRLFARAGTTPAVQELLRRLEAGGVLSLAGLSRPSESFVAALLHHFNPARTIVWAVEGLRSQERCHQDLVTWLTLLGACKQHPPLAELASRAARPDSAEPGSGPAGGPEPCLFFPAWDILPHEDRLPHADVISERLETLVRLASPTGVGSLVVTTSTALQQATLSPVWLTRNHRVLQVGDRSDPLALVEWLEARGYEPEAKVTQKGEISLRGGILDVYPLAEPWPVRVEFFGDEVESIRHFDPLTQVSRAPIFKVSLPPAGELGLLRRSANVPASTAPDASAPTPASSEEALAGAVGGPSTFEPDGLPAAALPPALLLDHLPPGTILMLSDPPSLEEQSRRYQTQVPGPSPWVTSWREVVARARALGITLLEMAEDDHAEPRPESARVDPEICPAKAVGDGAFPVSSSSSISLNMPTLEAFRAVGERAAAPGVAETQRREFFNQIHRWLRQDYFVLVLCNNDGERQRFLEVWTELGPPEEDSPAMGAPEGVSAPPIRPVLALGSLSQGFWLESARCVVITDAEVFGRYRMLRPRRLRSPHALAARSALDIDFSEFEDGDFVVHVQHGIGRFAGMGHLPLTPRSGGEGTGPECLVLEFAPADPQQPPPRLYVPVTEAHLVSKYVGAGKARPPLNTLGGTRWTKAKAQAERAVRDLAGDLLAIQAARESQSGHAFPPDTPWQREFENAFIFEETPDQWRAIEETKRDLEAAKPMDRLICGDVGFGKTEVAIRAAFKVVMGGRQAAVLVPTTVLAQQHFNTFRERMADYPVRVELLSRFRSRKEQQTVLRDLAAGAVDIVIGTHRLVQQDVHFKELGLVVIDEEQRFGVQQKERFKLLRRMVDVLTLSATPIPRTLYLALTGARDMSTIETPPQDRLPVETVVSAYDERLIRDAIRREINRQGQVFFLHNRVSTIMTVAQRLQQLIPEARVVVGHGQMDSDELEAVMTRFVNGEADVLLSTTIIESGLDIPNANTIIIDRADRFGLSDLYQLRGRVGRYKHQAYAYLLLPRHARLLTDVRKRLNAIKQYSTLGSGFKIAMRDLEIRGAGNLLGAEQSGHITAVGFELYCQLLKQSIARLKGQTLRRRPEVELRLDFIDLQISGATPEGEAAAGPPGDRDRARGFGVFADSAPNHPMGCAAVPLGYVSDTRQRIEIYRKLAQADQASDLEALRAELADRFGPLPDVVDLLLLVSLVRLVAGDRRITSVETRGDRLMLKRDGDYLTVNHKFPRLTRKQPKAKLHEIRQFLSVL